MTTQYIYISVANKGKSHTTSGLSGSEAPILPNQKMDFTCVSCQDLDGTGSGRA